MQIPIYSIVSSPVRILLICSIFLCYNHAWAQIETSPVQSEYVSYGVLYSDNYVSVELLIKLNPCSNTKVSRYRYLVKGTPRGYDYYLNWKMDYYNCYNSITRQTNYLNIGNFSPDPNGILIDDMDWSFSATQLLGKFYDVNASINPDHTEAFVKPLPMSVNPERIEGDLHIDYGDAVTLKQKGGALGENAEWYWYTSSCGGTPIARGESVVVRPLENTTYYVRAEGAKGNTDCATALVIVNTKSKEASSINGKTIICAGDKAPLSVNGGKIGKLAQWIWYQDSVGGSPIGTGSQIYVTPQRTTRYFVRAEGADNITESRDITIKAVTEQSTDPTGINGPSGICQGKNVILEVTGGILSSDAQWCWYRNSVSTQNLIGKGNNLNITPQQTATYIVQGEGACRTTTEQNIEVVITDQPNNPTGIDASATSVYRGNTVILSVHNSPGNNSQWVWYKKNLNGKPIGYGERIRVRARKDMVYYVRGENECGVSGISTQRLYVARRFAFVNVGIITSFNTPTNNGKSSSLSDEFNRAKEQQTFSLTVGKATRGGWYARIKYTLKNPVSAYNTDDKTVSDFNSTKTYYTYNGKTQSTRLAATIGFLTSLNRNTLLLNMGGGYGQRNLLWGITEYNNSDNEVVNEHWARHSTYSISGLEIEMGIMAKLPVFNIMVGFNGLFPLSAKNTDKKTFIDSYAGIGINF